MSTEIPLKTLVMHTLTPGFVVKENVSMWLCYFEQHYTSRDTKDTSGFSVVTHLEEVISFCTFVTLLSESEQKWGTRASGLIGAILLKVGLYIIVFCFLLLHFAHLYSVACNFSHVIQMPEQYAGEKISANICLSKIQYISVSLYFSSYAKRNCSTYMSYKL